MTVYGKRINGIDIRVNEDVATIVVGINERTRDMIKEVENRFREWHFKYANQHDGLFEMRYSRVD